MNKASKLRDPKLLLGVKGVRVTTARGDSLVDA